MINAEKALIFRIVHKNNVPWILDHGLYCQNSPIQDANYHAIGNPDLIERRRRHEVPIPPGGTLSDYIPFYFTPYTPMMYNIKTGYGGITQVPNEDLVILVASLHNLAEMGRLFVFTDRHAYLFNAEFYNDLDRLDQIDWNILQNKDFRHDPDDPGKMERYQAEALVHEHLPVGALIGMVCYTDSATEELGRLAVAKGLKIQVVKKTGWYF